VAFASRKWRNTENLIIDCLEKYSKFKPRLLGHVQENCRTFKDRTLEERYRKKYRKSYRNSLEKYRQNIENLGITFRS